VPALASGAVVPFATSSPSEIHLQLGI